MLDQYYPHVLGGSEWEVAAVVWDDRANFERKAHRFKKLVEAVAAHYGPLKPFGDEIVAIIKSAEELGKERNQHVHAIVHVNYEKNETLLMKRGKLQPCDEAGTGRWPPMRLVSRNGWSIGAPNSLGTSLICGSRRSRRRSSWISSRSSFTLNRRQQQTR